MKNILICKGIGKYGITQLYLDELAKAFEGLGYHVMIWDMVLDKDDLWGAIAEILEHHVIYALVDMNGGVCGAGGMVPEDADFLCLTYFCDHPMYHKERLNRMRDDTVIAVLDREHLRYLKTYYPRFTHVFFVPLGGMYREESDRSIVPYHQRRMDVIFTGSYWKPRKREVPGADDFAGQVREKIWNMLLSQTQMTLEGALAVALAKYGIAVSREEFIDLMEEVKDIDRDVRVYFRDRILRTLLAEGVNLWVFGDGWEELECEGRENLRLLQGDALVALRTLGDAKISLNIMPWFKDGFQERIANGMLNGAVAVTDTSVYVEEEFEDGKDIVLYSLDCIEELPDKIKGLLADEKRAEAIAKAGQRKAEKCHQWMHRAGMMVDMLERVQNERALHVAVGAETANGSI